METQAPSTSTPAQSPSSPPPPPQQSLPPSVLDRPPGVSEMEAQDRFSEDSSSVWDLDCLLDFSLDENLALSLDDYHPNSEVPQSLEPPSQEIPSSEKVRKRDPRLICSNYLAGRVPCACPELDAKLEEEGFPGKKRARTVRVSAGIARCQVPGCEADISELKGYHRRHRVCLRCANASTVMLDGEAKRYCQQCGKFHILSDFDEGKRSCRRKLERHNNRRRRKPTETRAAEDHEVQPVKQTEDDVGKDSSHISSEINDIEIALEHEDGQLTAPSSAPDTLNIKNDSFGSFVACGETQVNGGKENSNISYSPSYCVKSAYSSMCPTGRVSFKLYDWNPAEFPRRLRHQIFQWLASMPVELEGYIRPGCTILTVFVTMPKFMWTSLLEDPQYYVQDIVAPGKMLCGRGTIFVHLNDMVFCVLKDKTTVMEVQIKVHAPRLHYVHPTYFEAGKPMEFVACGSNLLQPKFRLLVSFSGKYLKYEYCVASPHNWAGDGISCAFDNQLYKICVPHTEPNIFGPAFIEVENESGLSNFIPVLIGDAETCSELETMQQKLDMSLLSKQMQAASGSSICSFCEAFALRHTAYSDLLLDIAWLLKDPTSEDFQRAMTASQIQRFCYLIDFLMCNELMVILEKILRNLNILTESMEMNNVLNRMSEADVTLLLKHTCQAREFLYQKHQRGGDLVLHSVSSEMEGRKVAPSCYQDNIPSVVTISNQGAESRADAKLGVRSPIWADKSERMPLLGSDIIMNMEELPPPFGYRHLARGFLCSRPAILMIASVAVCLGVCAALLHPGRVGEFAVSIRRCLFSNS
ncbi:squamosa promoter-binding-like protein 7 isoform X2 [Neltuma alba]|uniref:squamosa promoter-binding-like protein 7 isoform X2 n=1 Tax=Neltuma alba TaxID=207710 RepID=UPI0010A32195|nr:squamosa promoter-binding-like protein 7 isoform X2 [Prosopis alba]